MDIQIPEVDIEAYRREIDDLQKQMQSLASSNEYKKLGMLNAKAKSLEAIIGIWEELQKKLDQLEQSKELESDPELAAMAEAENQELSQEITKLVEELETATLPKLPLDENNAIMEIRSGTGGAEASLFAAEVMRMYVRYISSLGFTIEQVSTTYHEEGGIKEATLRINGEGSFGKMRFESGVHRVQRVPATESSGRIHTSAISVVIMPEIEPTEVEIKESDLRIETFRSSGPGGQSVNTTDSAVRITHIPSGITVSSQDGKSQHKNKDKAMGVLATKLYAVQQEEESKFVNDIRSQAIKSGDRSVKIRTYNYQQGRITDHRIKKTWYSLTQAIEGEISNIVTTVNSELRKQFSEFN